MNFNIQLDNPQKVINITVEATEELDTEAKLWTECQSQAKSQLMSGQYILSGATTKQGKLKQFKPDSAEE